MVSREEEADDSDDEGMRPVNFNPESFMQAMMSALGMFRSCASRIVRLVCNSIFTGMSDDDFSSAVKSGKGTHPSNPSGVFADEGPSFTKKMHELASDEEAEEHLDEDFPKPEIPVGGEATRKPERSLEDYMDQMDAELSGTKVRVGFEREAGGSGDDDDSDGESRPVDMDVNLLKNLLESFSSQEGLAGPASSMMMSMGIGLPKKRE